MKKQQNINRPALAAHVLDRLDVLREEHGFDDRNGWEQVNGRGEAKSRAYGEWEALQSLAERFELMRSEERS